MFPFAHLETFFTSYIFPILLFANCNLVGIFFVSPFSDLPDQHNYR